MAITTSFTEIQKKFNPKHWESIDDFENYYLRRIQETLADRNYYTDRYGVEIQIDFINHFPELKEYEVWSGGYAATCEIYEASLIGKAFARNFVQACDIVMCKNHLAWIEMVNSPDYKGYCPPSKWNYDPNRLSDLGCKLYWSEELARKPFID